MRRTCWLMLACAGVAVSCQSPEHHAKKTAITTAPSAQQAQTLIALWSYDQLPTAVLPTTLPTTRLAPLDSLDLYAQARQAMLEGRKYSALQMLEKAATIDPDSAEIQHLLAQIYLETEENENSSALNKVAAALTRAGELDPDNLEIWLQLGRIEQLRDHKEAALQAIRFAAQTGDYREHPEQATLIDLYLARALEANGYDRAALDRYNLVLKNLGSLGGSFHGIPDLQLLSQRPEILYQEIATLYERNGQYKDAARMLEEAVRRDDDSFEMQSRYARILVKAGETDQAIATAGKLVVRNNADARSVSLLSEIYRLAGQEKQKLKGLRRLHEQHPDDRALLMALIEGLEQNDKGVEAESLLEKSIMKPSAEPGSAMLDIGLLRRLVELKTARGEITGAAQTLVAAAVYSPKSLEAITGIMQDLTRAGRDDRLRLRALETLEVPPGQAQGARDYFAGNLAWTLQQSAAWRKKMESASKTYPPALLGAAEELLDSRFQASAAIRDKRWEILEERAISFKDEGLLLAVQGRRQCTEQNWQEGARILAEAVSKGAVDVDTRIDLALVLRQTNQNALLEPVLASLADDYPDHFQVRALCRNYYRSQNRMAELDRLDARYAARSPLGSKLRQMQQAALRGNTPTALRLAEELMQEWPDSTEAISGARDTFAFVHSPAWQRVLTASFERSPRSSPLLDAMLRETTANLGHREAAIHAIELARNSASDDADLLYVIANICRQYGLNDLHLQTLAQAIKVDPTNASAANDWAYDKADGPNLTPADLPECERLSRMAVEAYPDSSMFLDTLGWVLYKRQDFAGAATRLQRAAELDGDTDEAVLDHLGDAHWRLGNKNAAIKAWQAANNAMQKNDQRATTTFKFKVLGKLQRAGTRGEPAIAEVP